MSVSEFLSLTSFSKLRLSLKEWTLLERISSLVSLTFSYIAVNWWRSRRSGKFTLWSIQLTSTLKLRRVVVWLIPSGPTMTIEHTFWSFCCECSDFSKSFTFLRSNSTPSPSHTKAEASELLSTFSRALNGEELVSKLTTGNRFGERRREGLRLRCGEFLFSDSTISILNNLIRPQIDTLVPNWPNSRQEVLFSSLNAKLREDMKGWNISLTSPICATVGRKETSGAVEWILSLVSVLSILLAELSVLSFESWSKTAAEGFLKELVKLVTFFM